MEVLFSVENFQEGNGESFREINSPRTLEACLRSGLDPTELYPKPRSAFVSKKLTDDMIDIKYNMFESKRLDKIGIVKQERNYLVQYTEKRLSGTGGTGGTGGMAEAGADNNGPGENKNNEKPSGGLIAMEEKRLEALRRRQEKELAKIVEREHTLAELQGRVKRAEEEEMKKKKLHEKKVAEQKAIEAKKRNEREKEQKRMEEEEAQKKKALERKEAEIEEKIARARLEQERQIAREARMRDEERKRKVEESRRKTEALIRAQEEMAEENRRRMMEREERIMQQLEEKKEQKKMEVAMQREKAAKRIQEAVEKHHELFHAKKIEFERAQAEAAQRAKDAEIAERERLKKQADDRDRRNRQRLQRLVGAYQERRQHRQEIMNRRKEKDQVYDQIAEERERKITMMKFATELQLQDKQENVERVSRVKEFQRLQTLRRISEQDLRYEQIQARKREMIEKHREEQKSSLVRKHEISDVMERMRNTNDFTLMDKLFASKSRRNKTATRGSQEENLDGDGDPRLAQTA